MILYSVTVNIDEDVHDEWLPWMREVHIPDVLATGLFTGYHMFKILSRFPEETGVTYNIQYFLHSIEDYERYRTEFAPALQMVSEKRYSGKYTAFRTLLEEV
jgi:hypothetical protein